MTEAGRPKARKVHAVLAAAMADPILLERWRCQPASIAASGDGCTGIDVAKLWQFSGLVTKVRYSDLRSNLPLTFRILDATGLSIELFATYAPRADALRKAGLNSKSAKLAALMKFLGDWLDRTKPLHALVWDMVRHESTIFEVQAVTAGVASDPAAISIDSVPVRSAGTVSHELTCNPIEVAKLVRAGGDLASIPREKRLFAYCASEAGAQIRFVELDALAEFLVGTADGTRTVTELAELLLQCGITLEPQDLVDSVRALVTAGLLDIVNTGA